MEAQSSVNDLVQARPGLRSVTAPSPVATTAQAAMGVPTNGPGIVVSSGFPTTCVSDVFTLPSSGSPTPSQSLEVLSPTESVKSALTKLNSESVSSCPSASVGDSECQCGATSDSQAHHFRRLLLLHLQVIERQQTLMQMKDAEIEQLRADKEKLEVRVQRMERRVSLVGRRNPAKTSASVALMRSTIAEPTSPSPQVAEKRPTSEAARARLHSPPAKRRADRFINESCSSGRTSVSTSRASTPPISHTASSSVVASGLREPRKPPRSVQRPAYITTTDEYCVAGPVWPEEQAAPCQRGNAIEVPSFREVDFNTINSSTTLRSLDKEIENLDDEVFLRRHYKCEVEEKRIKRWDLQRTRSLRQTENLRRRYEEKEQKWRQSDTNENRPPQLLTSFMPSVETLESIEITNELPVTAFGRVIPNLPRCEFSLPWFDIAAREAEEEKRTTRSRSRSRLQLD